MKSKIFLTCLMAITMATASLSAQPKKYAVLIGSTRETEQMPDADMKAIWNDTYLLWEMLVTQYGFDNDRVFVLYGEDGDDAATGNPRYKYSNSGVPGITKITDLPAKYVDVENVFTGLKEGRNGYPQIQPDDFLFVFTFMHGVPTPSINGYPHAALRLQDVDMTDQNFSSLVNSVPCLRTVVWMANCTGGEFILTDPTQTEPEFNNSKTYFASASGTLSQPYSYPADDKYLLYGIQYSYADLENEMYLGTKYNHSEWFFHMYSNAHGKSPDDDLYYVQQGSTYANSFGIGDYTEFDYNQDGYKTMKELFDYANQTNSCNQYASESDLGAIGNYCSLDYPTLLHDNLTQNMVCRGLIGISNNTTVKAGYTLEIKDNAIVQLLDGSKLTVESGASLIVENGVQFINASTSDKTIEISGNLTTGQNVTYTGLAQTKRIVVIVKNGQSQNNLTGCSFTHSALKP